MRFTLMLYVLKKKTSYFQRSKSDRLEKGNNRVFDICGYFFLKNHSRECSFILCTIHSVDKI